MKKKSFFVIVLLCVVLVVPSFAQWRQVKYAYLDSTKAYRTLFFVDSLHGWMSRDKLTSLVLTTNGGKSWFQNEPFLGANSGVQLIYFLNKDIGWLVDRGFLSRSTDGGRSWKALNNKPDFGVGSMSMLNEKVGFFGEYDKIIYKTTNGGDSWDSVGYITTPVDEFNRHVRSIHFLDEQRGFCVGQSKFVYMTTNGGKTWQSKNIIGANFDTFLTFLWLKFTSDSVGWAHVTGFSNDVLYKTTDRGETWKAISTIGTKMFLKVHMVNDNLGAVFNSFFIYRTTDGGVTWKQDQVIREDDPVEYVTGAALLGYNSGFITSFRNRFYQYAPPPSTDVLEQIQSTETPVNAYPNPTSATLAVDLNEVLKNVDDAQTTSIELCTLQGTVEKSIQTTEKFVHLDVQDVIAGTYLLIVKNGNTISSKPIVVLR